MRIRTWLTLGVGAAGGAGVMYLLDPASGERRRRELRRDALHTAKQGAVTATRSGAELGRELASAAVAGYQDARADADDATSTT